MANVSKLQVIRQKRRGFEQEIERLQAEVQRLAIAESVLADLENLTPETDGLSQFPSPQEGTAKPEGIPTMPEMITEALKVAKSNGHKGLEPKEIANYIEQKWWPNVPINAVGPIAWRMATRQQLKKRQSRYSLPSEAEGT